MGLVSTASMQHANFFDLFEGEAELVCACLNEPDQEAFALTVEPRPESTGQPEGDQLYSIHYYNIETSFRFRYDLGFLCPAGTLN